MCVCVCVCVALAVSVSVCACMLSTRRSDYVGLIVLTMLSWRHTRKERVPCLIAAIIYVSKQDAKEKQERK